MNRSSGRRILRPSHGLLRPKDGQVHSGEPDCDEGTSAGMPHQPETLLCIEKMLGA